MTTEVNIPPGSDTIPGDNVWAPPNKAVDDNGKVYNTVQAAVNNTSSSVLIGPGTFNETVDITTDNIELLGVGRATTINGGSDDHAIHVDGASDVNIENLSVKTTSGGGSGKSALRTDQNSADNFVIRDVYVLESDLDGIHHAGGADATIVGVRMNGNVSGSIDGDGITTAGGEGGNTVKDSTVQNVGGNGIDLAQTRDSAEGNTVVGCDGHGIVGQENFQRLSHNICDDNNDDGINISGTDQVISANVAINSTNQNIDDSSATDPIKSGNLAGSSADDNQGGGTGSAWTTTTKTSNYTASDNDEVLADSSSSAVTVTLPSPSNGVRVRVKRISSSNSVTVSRNATEQINRSASDYSMSDLESVEFVSDGTDWWIV